MIKVVAGISIVAGIIIGAIADSAAIGGEVAGGFFIIGLLIIIADAAQRMAPMPDSRFATPEDDSDIVEDIELVFDEARGELVEVPATPKRRRR